MEKSIVETFRDGTFLITGSTGFLGKLLTEKLLRSCFVKNIAILVRNKKGLNADQRIADIYKQTVSTKYVFENFKTFLILRNLI